MKVFRTPSEVRAWSLEQRCAGKSVGLVPTMGALHVGHGALMKECAKRDDARIFSLFVNPAQFAPHEDYAHYPRTFDRDCELAAEWGMEAVYCPTAEAMYPEGYTTYVTVEELDQRLCSVTRPHFFRGVATVVTKLFNAVLPNRAYFGQKDAQQCAIIRRMVQDLDFGVEIVAVPTVREPDGLAFSSRNEYLNAADRERALGLSRGLQKGRALIEAGERDPNKVIEAVRQTMNGVEVDYVELVNADTIQPLDVVEGKVLLAVAAKVGKARLIDNIIYEVPQS